MSVLTDAMRQQIDDLLPRYPSKQAVTLPALHMVQDHYRCVPLGAVEEIGQILGLSSAEVFDTLSFYGFFRTEEDKLGRHRVWVCRSLPCQLRAGEQLLADLSKALNVKPGHTTRDGKITLEFAECLGMCEGAPCILVDDELHGNMTLDKCKSLFSKLPAAAGR